MKPLCFARWIWSTICLLIWNLLYAPALPRNTRVWPMKRKKTLSWTG